MARLNTSQPHNTAVASEALVADESTTLVEPQIFCRASALSRSRCRNDVSVSGIKSCRGGPAKFMTEPSLGFLGLLANREDLVQISVTD